MKYKIKYNLEKKGGSKVNIFTFWEPKDKLPYYLKLCFNTWNKIKNSNLILLDYSNLKDYIDIDEIFSSNFYKLSLPMQADCIRVALLEKYGGLWLDLDTIILSDISDLFNQKLTMITDKKPSPHLALIHTVKPNNFILKKWLEEIKVKLIDFKNVNWDYVGNSIINKYFNDHYFDYFNLLDRDEYHIFPELEYKGSSNYEKYINFWFNDNNISDIKSQYIIMLHNSWTPEYYKSLNKSDFYKDTNLLSRYLIKLQNIEGGKKTNLMIVAHPDDELLWGGQMLIDYPNWKVVCITNGNDIVRKNDFIKVMNKLNAKYEIFNFIDSYDYTNPILWDDEIKKQIKLELNRIVNENNYNMIVTHNKDGETGHIHHKLVHELVTEIVNDKDKLFYFNVNKSKKLNMSKEKEELLKMYTIGQGAIQKWWNLSKKEDIIPYNLKGGSNINGNNGNIKTITLLNEIRLKDKKSANWIEINEDRLFMFHTLFPMIGKYLKENDKKNVLDIGIQSVNIYDKQMLHNNDVNFYAIDLERFDYIKYPQDWAGLYFLDLTKNIGNQINLKFDVIIDYGVIGWGGVHNKITKNEIEKYFDNIKFLLSSDGIYFLKLDYHYKSDNILYIKNYIEKEFNLTKFYNLEFKKIYQTWEGIKNKELYNCYVLKK